MRHFNSRISMVAVLASCLLTGACKKNKESSSSSSASTDTEQTTANDNNLAETIVNDIETIGGQLTDGGSLSTFRTSGENALASTCATITGINTNVVTVDFGIVGCYGSDGRTRSGKLIYTITNSTAAGSVHYRNPGFGMVVSSINYMVDSVRVNINNKTITNTTPVSIPSAGTPTVNLTWAYTADLNLTKANNTTFTFTCTHGKELINTNDPACYHGQQLPITWSKAIIQLNGSASGTNVMNESFSATLTNLVRNYQCGPVPAKPNYHPFINGTVAYAPGSRPQRLINYGSNICDNVATITIGSQTFSVVLF